MRYKPYQINIFSQLLNFVFPKNGVSSSIHSYINQTDIDTSQFFTKKLTEEQSKILERIYALTSYSDKTVKGLIQKAKFYGEFAIAKDLARVLHKISKEKIDLNFDVITSIPPDPKRIKKRGFHIPKIIAKEFSKISNIKYKDLLIKTRNTKPQTELKKKERLINLSKTFQIKSGIDLTKIKSICIIDEVSTTGSTLFECAKTIKKHNKNVKIYGLTLSST